MGLKRARELKIVPMDPVIIPFNRKYLFVSLNSLDFKYLSNSLVYPITVAEAAVAAGDPPLGS